MSGDSKPILGYWDIRGLAGPIRLMLHYAKVDFVDKLYSCGPAPTYDRSCWFNEKFTLGLPFANLPYYIDGDTKIVQNLAICRYVARKYGFEADDEVGRIRVDIVENQLVDLRNAFVNLAYRSFSEENKAAFLKGTQAGALKGLNDYICENEWFAGKKLTYVDFMAYEIFVHQTSLKKDCICPYPKLVKFMKRFEELPQIKAYFNSPSYVKIPINNRMAAFGNTADY